MHPNVITKRKKAAEIRLTEALATLAGEAGADAAEPVSSRDSDLRAMFTLEALADTAEAIVKASNQAAAAPEADEENDKPKRGRKKATG